MSRAEAFTCMLRGAHEATVSFRSISARLILLAGLGLAALAPSAAAQAAVFVVRLLARFRPTRIALESPASRQRQLDAAYTAFLEDRATLGPAEGQQLGFRLARELGHERVYAVDAPASLKVVLPLRDFLVWANEPERVLLSHGAYLIGGFYLGRDGDYFGPDMRTRWYNRNLRIFHNLQRLTRSPAERILVIIGSGHLPILRHAVKASPEYRLVEAGDYLRR